LGIALGISFEEFEQLCKELAEKCDEYEKK